MSVTISKLEAAEGADEIAVILREYLVEARDQLVAVGGAAFDVERQMGYTLGDLGSYMPPSGAVFVARGPDAGLVGIAFLRRLRPEVSEIKRTYVRPLARGTGLGAALVHEVIAEARRMGSEQLFLDTLTSMSAAVSLYRRLGFTDIERFPEAQNPPEIWPHAIYLALEL